MEHIGAHIGIDVHKRDSPVCVLGETGKVVLERRVPIQRGEVGRVARPTSAGSCALGGLYRERVGGAVP